MGARGPAPKPTKLKILEGNKGKRPLNLDAEVQPEKVMPEKPRGMNAAAQKEWDFLAPKLFSLGLLTEVDGAALRLYCESYAMYQASQKHLKKSTDYAVEGAKGTLVKSPYIAVRNEAFSQMKQMLALFGLSPSDRTKLQVQKPEKEKSPWDGI